MFTEADIIASLRDCFDPGMRLNVVDLGMIEDIRLTVDEQAPGAGIAGVPVRQRLWLRMLTTDADEEKWSLLRGQILNRLAGLEGISLVELVRMEEAWSPERISAAGRKALGLDGVLFPILNNSNSKRKAR